ERENDIINNPDADLPPSIRIITDNSYDKLLKRYKPDQLDRAKKFYDNANEFILRFYKAGGRIKEGADPPRGMAGLLMHQALVMDVEAGVSPMAAIQSATINVAKNFGRDKDYGSVRVEGEPLAESNRAHLVVGFAD